MAIPMTTDPVDLLTLTQWLSPAFPVGGFAFSHGMENVLSTGRLQDATGVRSWLAGVLEQGSGRSDAVLLAMTLQGTDPQTSDALARALAASPERLAESLDQGRAFLNVTNVLRGTNWSDLTLPVAVGVQARALTVSVETVLSLYLQSFASNLVLGAVRLVPLGQTEGQKIVQDLAPLIRDLSHDLASSGPQDLGSAAFAADLAAMAHEHQEVRLFRS